MVYILIGYIDDYIYIYGARHARPTDRSIDRSIDATDRSIDRGPVGSRGRPVGWVLLTSHDSKRERHTPTRRGLHVVVARARSSFIHSEALMGGRVRRRAGTMDPPPSTSRADEGRGEGTREANERRRRRRRRRSIRRGGFITHAFEWIVAWAHAGGGTREGS